MSSPAQAGLCTSEETKARQVKASRAFCLAAMPTAAPRPCRHAGCGALVHDGSGYCAAHQDDRKIGKFADDRRGSRHERGYGQAWERLRKAVLSRDKGLCQVCLGKGRYTPARQVDHIMPKASGGTDATENLQAICEACHRAKSAREGVAARGEGA